MKPKTIWRYRQERPAVPLILDVERITRETPESRMCDGFGRRSRAGADLVTNWRVIERSHGHSKWARARDAMRASKQAFDPQITLTREA